MIEPNARSLQKLSVIGTGAMGAAVAEALLAAGHEVTVFNRTASKTDDLVALGAKRADSVVEALQAAEHIILALSDWEATERLLLDDAVSPSLSGRSLLIITTSSVENTLAFQKSLAAHGARLSEATVTVYPSQMRARDAYIILGGAAEDLAEWSDILGSVSASVSRAGELGAASKAEIALSLSYMYHTISVAQTLAMVRQLGLPEEAVVPHLVSNPVLQVAGCEPAIRQMVAGKYETQGYSINNFLAGVGASVSEAERAGVRTEVPQAILAAFQRAADLGHGDKDIAAVIEALVP